MRAGTLRNTIIIEANTPTKNGFGEDVDSWGTFATVRAQIVPINGKEYFSAGQEQASVSHKIKLRYLAGITQAMRINYEGRYFDIQAIINFQERNIDLEIMAVERVEF